MQKYVNKRKKNLTLRIYDMYDQGCDIEYLAVAWGMTRDEIVDTLIDANRLLERKCGLDYDLT